MDGRCFGIMRPGFSVKPGLIIFDAWLSPRGVKLYLNNRYNRSPAPKATMRKSRPRPRPLRKNRLDLSIPSVFMPERITNSGLRRLPNNEQTLRRKPKTAQHSGTERDKRRISPLGISPAAHPPSAARKGSEKDGPSCFRSGDCGALCHHSADLHHSSAIKQWQVARQAR